MKNKQKIRKLERLKELKIKESYLSIIYWFFAYPNIGITLSDLASNLNISKTKARKIVLELANRGFLMKEELGRLWRISCDKNHIYNYTIKVSYNLWLVYMNNLVYEVRKKIPNARAIILFGSYRKGDDDENSDIDLAVEVLGNEDPKIEQFSIIPQLGYRKNIKVNLYVFSRKNIDLNLFNNIANGIILDGFLEVRP